MQWWSRTTPSTGKIVIVAASWFLAAVFASPALTEEATALWRAARQGGESQAEWLRSGKPHPRMPATVLSLQRVPALLRHDGTISELPGPDSLEVCDVSANGQWAAISIASAASPRWATQMAVIDSLGREAFRMPIPPESRDPYAIAMTISDDGRFLILGLRTNLDQETWGTCRVYGRKGEEVFTSADIDVMGVKRFAPNLYCMSESHDARGEIRYVARDSTFQKIWEVPVRTKHAYCIRDHYLLSPGIFLLVIQDEGASGDSSGRPRAVRFVRIEVGEGGRSASITTDTTTDLEDSSGRGVDWYKVEYRPDGPSGGDVAVAYLILGKSGRPVKLSVFSAASFERRWGLDLGVVSKVAQISAVTPRPGGDGFVVVARDDRGETTAVFSVGDTGRLLDASTIPSVRIGWNAESTWLSPTCLLVRGRLGSVALVLGGTE